MDSCAITDRGCVRKGNQDACFIHRDDGRETALLLVCDGMGGHNAGNVASSLAATVFAGEVREGLPNARVTGAVRELLDGALRTANSAVYELSRADESCRGMGTTMVAAVVMGKDATFMNVGDSRGYLLSGGVLRQVTRDHSVVQDMVERGEITREQSRTHPRKNLITRAVGTSYDVEADFFALRLKEGDRILLCSDGLSNVVTDAEITETLSFAKDTATACGLLMETALERGAPDNVTVALLSV